MTGEAAPRRATLQDMLAARRAAAEAKQRKPPLPLYEHEVYGKYFKMRNFRSKAEVMLEMRACVCLYLVGCGLVWVCCEIGGERA